MSKWGWEETVNIGNNPVANGLGIHIADDDYKTCVVVTIESSEEFQALIERLEELAEELGWNNDQR